jgi:hypothetical protein
VLERLDAAPVEDSGAVISIRWPLTTCDASAAWNWSASDAACSAYSVRLRRGSMGSVREGKVA